ncbi:MAG: glycosyltransferase [Candidatus Bathyarchaeota archaeon]|nr:MAG: glycosyltransferase [Candidatus Bathyarchaeota archaeon]
MLFSNGFHQKILVGICAYNEENNIGKLLSTLLKKQNLPSNSKILVVCSGCTDKTPQIVKELCKSDARIELVVEKFRKGKANALNKIFRLAASVDFLILVNGDALPKHGSIEKLILNLQNEKVGAAFARPVPLNKIIGVANRIVHIVWKLHHYVSLYKAPKLSAELCAIRTECLREIPEHIATDEPYIELSIRKQGYAISYAPDAVVFIRCPTSLIDLFKQRKRIWTGHLQVRKMTDFVVSTSDFRNIAWIVSMLKLDEIPYGFLGAIIEGLAYLMAKLNLMNGKIPYAWEPVKSTKTAITSF